MGRPKNLAGQIFGRLKVIRRKINNSGNKKVKWICTCVCGNKTTASTNNLTSGNTKSCGCMRLDNLRLRFYKGKDAAVNSIFTEYRSGAKESLREFRLTKPELEWLISQRCYYCGDPPSNERTTQGGYKLMYNGIDRINNDLGYDKNNVVPACKRCNFMKSNLSKKEFILHVNQIAKHLGLSWSILD